METYPKGTTKEQWDQYEKDLAEFETRMNARRPKIEDYPQVSDEDYRRDLSEWEMALSCDAPNKPGYYRANND